MTYGDKYADALGYDEMLGLVAAISLPEKRPLLQWLKTAEQHQLWRDNLNKKSEDDVAIQDNTIIGLDPVFSGWKETVTEYGTLHTPIFEDEE